jgi:hypothetical protein
MVDLAKIIIFLGAVLIVVGLVILFLPKLPFPGKLPGDIVIRKENFTFYFPLATSIVISLVVSLILYLVGKCK